MAAATTTRKRTVRDPFVGPYATEINAAAGKTGVDPWELAAVLKNESGFDQKADNGADRGIAQINRAAHPEVTDAQAFNPAFAIPWAADYLRKLERAAGSWTGALRAYNTGNPKPSTAGDTYVARVESAYRSLRGTVLTWLGVPTAGVSSTLLARVGSAVAEVGGTAIDVTSGKRAPGPGNDVANSNHITGNALDGYAIIAGQRVPLGTAIKPVAAKWGLRSGDVAGFDPRTPGGFDPVHVDDGANVNGGQPLPSTTTTGGAQDTSVRVPVPGFLPGFGPSITIPGINLPDPFKGITDATGLLKKLFNDPAGTLGGAVLFLALMLLGFALIYLGITRLLGTKPIPSVVPVPV